MSVINEVSTKLNLKTSYPIDCFYPNIDLSWEDSSVAHIVVSLNEVLIRTEGIYAPRFFTGIVDVTLRFNEDYYPEILKYNCDDNGEFYEHDYITDFVYQDVDPSNEDMKVFEKALFDKVLKVVGFNT